MPASRAQRATTAARRGKAVAMRLAGLDFQTIADRLGYADRAAAHKDITRALESNVAEMHRNADVLRQEELARLDRLQAGAWTAAAAGDVKAIQAVLGIIDRRCKLLGLDVVDRRDQPLDPEPELGPVGVPVVQVSVAVADPNDP